MSRFEKWFDRDPFGNAITLYLLYLLGLGLVAMILALVFG